MQFKLCHWFAEDAGLTCLPWSEVLGQDREMLNDAASITVMMGMNRAVQSFIHRPNESQVPKIPCRQLQQQTLCNGCPGLSHWKNRRQHMGPQSWHLSRAVSLQPTITVLQRLMATTREKVCRTFRKDGIKGQITLN